MTETLYWYWLCNINGIGNKKIKALLSYFGTPENIFTSKEKELKKSKILRGKDIINLIQSKTEDVIKNFKQLEERGIVFVYKDHTAYPKRLLDLEDAPYSFYYKGKLPSWNKPVLAIIGSRKHSLYGREMATYFSKHLSMGGIQIISGMARGIDTFAHQGSLLANKPTYAVLGNGLDICYPPENYQLMEDIEQNGGIISEYNLGVAPKPGHFPMRNRIISGLCDGIFVIEARERSGSLITVDLGLEYGKDIFALPGRATDVFSEGCNNLIKMGAKLVTQPDDVFEEFSYKEAYNYAKSNNEDKKIINSLEIDEKIVYACLSLEKKHIDMIIRETAYQAQKVLHILLSLELKGIIKQVSGNYYITCV